MEVTRLLLIDDGLVIITPEKTQVISDEVIIKNYFDNLAKKQIKKMVRTKDKEFATITFADNNRFQFRNFNEIKKKKFCAELNKEISKFKFKQIASKISGKNVVLTLGAIGTTTITANVLNESIDAKATANDTSIVSSDDSLNPFNVELEDIQGAEKPTDYSEEVTYIQENDKILTASENKDDELSNETNNDELDLDPLSFSNIGNENSIDEYFNDEYIDSDTINIEDLKNLKSYEEFTLFACKLFGVDYDKACELIKNEWHTFSEPGKVVDEHFAAELDRMKDLVSKGLINGDMNIIGIFLTIKNYANDYLNISDQAPIISNKTPEEREKDVVYMAKYIYGVENQELLNTMIAAARIESGCGKSDAAINKNNIGGNMSSKSTPDHLILNTYKTAEIGEESFVRNFLYCYGKASVKFGYDQSIPIPKLVSVIYCAGTADEWADAVSGIIVDQDVENTINKYLGNTKTI